MEGSPQHPFTVEIEDGTVIGGAQTESDAVTLAAGAVAVVKGTLLVRDSSAGTITAQIGRLDEPQSSPTIGPVLDSINPASTAPGLPPQVLTCTGSQFEEGAEILWGDVAQPTTFHSEAEVSARLDVEPNSGASGERVAVQVQNPDGNVSGTVYFVWE
jgi:hypothetical protein